MDHDLKLYFCPSQAPVRANVKKGLLTSLKGALDDARFHNHKVSYSLRGYVSLLLLICNNCIFTISKAQCQSPFTACSLINFWRFKLLGNLSLELSISMFSYITC